jgi:phage N-6-adenine-methyltransferase
VCFDQAAIERIEAEGVSTRTKSRRCARSSCRAAIVAAPTGRPRRFCSSACRSAAFRRRARRPVHLRSGSVEWATPIDVFEKLNAEFGPFDLDVCATAENTKVASHYFTIADNGLDQEWTGTIWMNPPYTRAICAWVAKAHAAAQAGATVVALLPSRTGTKWFRDYCLGASECRFLPGRLHFNDGAGSATFASIVVVFRRDSTVTKPTCARASPFAA